MEIGLLNESPGLVTIEMPLCRSDKGIPTVAIPFSAAFIASDSFDEGLWEIYKVDALEILEMRRQMEHGDDFPLPSVDPKDWELRLVKDTRGAEGKRAVFAELHPK